jgi:hypothetical protein
LSANKLKLNVTQHERPATYIINQQHSSVTLMQTMPGVDIDSDHSLLVANIFTRLKKIRKFRKEDSRWTPENLRTQPQKEHDILEVNLDTIECRRAVQQYQEKCAKYGE